MGMTLSIPFSLSGDSWHFWHFREQLLHLGAQLLADEEHVQPVVGKLDYFVFDFKISNSAVLIQECRDIFTFYCCL